MGRDGYLYRRLGACGSSIAPLAFLLAAFLVAALPQAAAAVASRVSVSVTDSVGRPVAGAKISLGGVEATTNSRGDADLVVEDGEHALSVEHDDFAAHEETVAVPAGGTSVRVRLRSRSAPGGGGVVVGRTPAGGVPVAVNVGTDRAETPKQRGTTTETITDGGAVVFTETLPQDVAAENREFEDETTVDSAEVEVSLALRRRGGHAALGVAAGGGLAGSSFFSALQGGGAGAADEQPRFLPILSLAVGQADVELEIRSRNDPSLAFRFSDEATIWGGGLDLVWMLCDDCGWHLGAGYRYRTVDDVEADRRPAVIVLGAVTVEDSARLDYESHQAHLFVGHGWPRVAVYGGVRQNRRELEFEGRQVFDFSTFFGRPVIDTVTTHTELEADETEALLGTLFRFGDSNFYGRLEASSDGDNETVTAGVTVALGQRR